MAATSRSKQRKRARLRVGDRVSFQFGLDQVRGTIIEDRGNLASGGKQLLRVRVRRSDADDLIIELPADQLEAA